MFCRVEILKAKRVLCLHHKIGACLTEIEEYAESERRLHRGDGFRLRDLHTDQVWEVGPDNATLSLAELRNTLK